MKTHWKRLVNPDYIGAYSLDEGKDLVVTLGEVKRLMVTSTGGKQEECTVAELKGQKPFIINVTNAKSITQVVGSPYIEDWQGQKITLFVSKTKLKGEEVECLRVRPTKPSITKPKLLITDIVNFEKVKKAIENGYTLEQIKSKWDIDAEVKKSLGL